LLEKSSLVQKITKTFHALNNVKKRLADDKIRLLIYTFARRVRSFLLSFLRFVAGFPADRLLASSTNKVRSSLMLKLYVKASETLRQLRSDVKGVVSFEYIVVAASVVAAVVAVFATTGPTGISGALSSGIAKIVSQIPK
jgi:pilus assembly protein Flp/PilA